MMTDMMQTEYKRPCKSVVIISLIAAAAGLLFFCFLIKRDIEKTEIILISHFQETEAVQVVIEEAVHSVYINISGYAYKKDEPIETVDTSVVLHHIEKDEYIKIPTMLIQRPDLNETRKDGYDYTYA